MMSYNDNLLTSVVIDLVYVDIDDDNSTFLLNLASLKSPNNNTRIVNTVLFWSITYSYIKRNRREENA